MLHRRTRVTSGLAVAATAILLSAPAAHAVSGSEADASAATIAIAGQGAESGSASATFDGQQETRSGNNTPTIPSGGFIGLGVLTQQATAGDGTSASCGGVAGNGGGTIQIGEGSCIDPGDTINGSLGDLSLDALGPGLNQLPEPARTVVGTLTGSLDSALAPVFAAIEQQAGGSGFFLRLDAVEGRCTYSGGSATGTASIANAALVTRFNGSEVTLVNLPANPAPNTEVTTDLDKVVDTILGSVSTQLNTALNGSLSQADQLLLAPVRAQLVAFIRDNIAAQLAPVRDNLLSVVLNEQTRNGQRLDVTALHAKVLPAASQAIGAPAVDIKLGSAGCGPAAARVIDPTMAPTPEPTEPPRGGPRVPTAVSAGAAGQPADGPGILPYAALAMGATAAGAAGVSAVRRRSALRG